LIRFEKQLDIKNSRHFIFQMTCNSQKETGNKGGWLRQPPLFPALIEDAVQYVSVKSE